MMQLYFLNIRSKCSIILCRKIMMTENYIQTKHKYQEITLKLIVITGYFTSANSKFLIIEEYSSTMNKLRNRKNTLLIEKYFDY